MEKGELGARGTTSVDMWLSPSRNKWFGGGPNIIAYKCPQCGKVELTTKDENK